MLGAKRLASKRFTAKFKDKYFILLPVQNTGKADKTNNNDALVKTIPVTSGGFLKCKRTYFVTSFGIY